MTTYALSVSPDALASLGSFVAREWGDYGYRFEGIESPTYYVTVGHVVASDGSRFDVCVDRWGNCRSVPEGAGWRDIVDAIMADLDS